MRNTNENLFGEQLCLGGQPVVGFADDVGPVDLFSYRRMWEPFVAAHLNLWRMLNENMEDMVGSQQCPPGIFAPDQIANMDTILRAHCAALDMTRIRISDTDPNGILTQWNLWQGSSSSQILAAADVMLKQQQDVVMNVAGPYKDQLLTIAKQLGIAIKLPPTPAISTQQNVIAQLEGAYTTVKGILQVGGYAAGSTLMWAGDQTKAVTEGLTDTVKGAGEAAKSSWTWIALGIGVAIVGAGVIIYYVPRSTQKKAAA